MNRVTAITALALLASGCDKPSSQDRAQNDARAVAQVEAAQKLKAPAQPIAPQPLEPADIAAFKQIRGCAFALAASGHASASPAAVASQALAMPIALIGHERGLVKAAGEAMIFASDTGSARFPADSYEKYVGRGHTLTFTKGDKALTDGGAERWPGSMTIRDHLERVVFFAPGELTCSR